MQEGCKNVHTSNYEKDLKYLELSYTDVRNWAIESNPSVWTE